MAENNSKNRKPDSMERFEEADNSGRFAGDDPDARAARQQAIEEVRMDSGSNREERTGSEADETTDAGARGKQQADDFKGEAQNVNDDTGRPLNEEETEQARNKALEGQRQQESKG